MKSVVALLALAVLALAPGDLNLEVAGDGAEGVTVRALSADGRPAEGDLRLVLTATAEGGRTVGPLQLNAASEGRGFYSSGPVLPAGATWTVVVTGAGASPVKASAVVTSRTAQSPPAVAKPVPPPAASPSRLWIWGLAAAVAAGAFAVVAVVRRRA